MKAQPFTNFSVHFGLSLSAKMDLDLLRKIFAKQQDVSSLLQEIRQDLHFLSGSRPVRTGSPVNLQGMEREYQASLVSRGHQLAERFEQRQDAMINRIATSCLYENFAAQPSRPFQASGHQSPTPPISRPKIFHRCYRKVKPFIPPEKIESSPFHKENLNVKNLLEEMTALQDRMCDEVNVVAHRIEACSTHTVEVEEEEEVCLSENLSPVKLHTSPELPALPFKNTPPDMPPHSPLYYPPASVKWTSKIPRLGSLFKWKRSVKIVTEPVDVQKTVKKVTPMFHIRKQIEVQKNQEHKRSLFSPGIALRLLGTDSKEWEKKIEGLWQVRVMAEHQPGILLENLDAICLAVSKQVKNIRSAVSQEAIVTLGHLYEHLKGGMNAELKLTATVLLQKAGDRSQFIRDDVCRALRKMVQNCGPTGVLHAILEEGLSHRNSAVRECTARCLKELAEILGPSQFVSSKKNYNGRFLNAICRLAVDPASEVRYQARTTLTFLASHENFLMTVDRSVDPAHKATIKYIITKARGT
ncbi:uncharacterized protein LOC127453957 isoform X2 [Myxocyprinus asiaticus]|uniref:uncharacterized protein LOC127453957 isoform X2 n=1 Tax=Myxocyprinus asiaticus TaxID=70543 RepID=UPI002221EECA|nr:uncharacterized protein LOC127453957 isoform X2 [Myxocyprinus asiaticus]